ncbi:hypothetical protein IW261DRAFT_592540 [Armillaria novae-zelandiae]|uniref:Uncharacterized protein n=1 Tax=Armillaria novae-zelandiae TaxID=153914 RepID=A0AA39PMM1_9AGAR|nr:hypothetical protein IW261DRAFT_592540 [Armillaria novae-zelandiae]
MVPYKYLSPGVAACTANGSYRFLATGRRPVTLLFTLIMAGVVLWLTRYYDLVANDIPSPVPTIDTDHPPSYDWLRQWEHDLPQHNLSLSAPEGKAGRYVKFSSQTQMLGWNNVLGVVLMDAHLAHESGRAYVFSDYIWEPAHYPWTQKDEYDWPPRTPLSALLAGPAAGGLWESGDDTPRSVSSEWFDVVCPRSERRFIPTSEVKQHVGWSEGDVIFDRWASLLREAPEPCIEVTTSPEDSFPQVFDLWLWGNTRILSMWESFSNSATSRLLATSPIVKSGVDRNEYLFLPNGPRPLHPVSHNPYERMLAMHLRRGDYEGSCRHFSKYSSTFYGWNQLEFLPDRFMVPPGEEGPERDAVYLSRCLPTFEDVIKKVRLARGEYLQETGATLDVMYLLTNEKGQWLEELREALRVEGWNTIRTSRDLVWDSTEQKELSMAVDMDIARQAAVFVGNGWSSFSSNIVHRRLVDGKKPISTRFF